MFLEFLPYVFQVLSLLLELRKNALPESHLGLFPFLLTAAPWERQGKAACGVHVDDMLVCLGKAACGVHVDDMFVCPVRMEMNILYNWTVRDFDRRQSKREY